MVNSIISITPTDPESDRRADQIPPLLFVHLCHFHCRHRVVFYLVAKIVSIVGFKSQGVKLSMTQHTGVPPYND